MSQGISLVPSSQCFFSLQQYGAAEEKVDTEFLTHIGKNLEKFASV
jgi:hypothetical protein